MFTRQISKGLMETAIQMAGFRAITAARVKPDIRNSEFSTGRRTYSFMSIPSVPQDILGSEFLRLELAAVLRDVIEQFSIYLHRLYEVVETEADAGRLPTNSEKFERLSISEQLLLLEESFGMDPAWGERLAGYNKLRNCLAHRGGKVGEQDLTDGGLTVRWISAEIDFLTDHPKPTTGMDHLIKFEHQSGRPGARAFLTDHRKTFPLNSVVSLSLENLLEILQTFQVASAAFAGFDHKKRSQAAK